MARIIHGAEPTSFDTPTSFTVRRIRDGGFTVSGRSDFGTENAPLFAASSIDEALKYVKKALETPK